MSFLQKLCDAYDAVIDTAGAQGENALLPVGFIQKKIKYDILLSPSGEFITARQLPDGGQSFAVPSSPQAEGRTGSSCAPFPLADELKYLIADRAHPFFEGYIAQLTDWCHAPHAPECLRILLNYLKKERLHADLRSVSGLRLRYSGQDGEGADAKSVACFSIAFAGEEQRLWMREDVRQSWVRLLASRPAQSTGLCCVTGLRLPIMENHPKLQGNAKLISSRDTGFPFQYKGRFVEERSAATVSVMASCKAHNALKWLLERQGFRRYGMSLVGWNTKAPALEPVDEKPAPDTFEPYLRALFNSIEGDVQALEAFSRPDELSADVRQRIEHIVLVGLQAATNGRMSVTYEQEMPGNLFSARVRQWHEACRWQMPSPPGGESDRPATWREICEAVMGADAVRIAMSDFNDSKAATKRMRELQLRLLHCTVDGQALPRSMVEAAFHRAVQPLSFTNARGKWDGGAWLDCVATACAMIRRHALDRSDAPVPSPALDASCTDRDYLYGRLFAMAHGIERAASGDGKTSAVRLMTRFVQQPGAAWPELYRKLLPCLRTLGEAGYAQRCKRQLGRIEGLFRAPDVRGDRPLSYRFLIGFSAQSRAFSLDEEDSQAQLPPPDAAPPKTRDELFGCLLAVADCFEWHSERQEAEDGTILSSRDGRTNAMRLTAAFADRPMTTWPKIHDRLIPYLEKCGVKAAADAQSLLCKIEQCFLPEERLSDAPLGRGFLHGYLTMLEALSAESGLNRQAWKPAAVPFKAPSTRDAAFGMLLALENQMERYALDLEKTEEENRPSNAMRFMARTAQRPNEVWGYLAERMRPYQRKSGFSEEIRRRADALHAFILERQWDSDAPLGPAYLYYFYLYNQSSERKDE